MTHFAAQSLFTHSLGWNKEHSAQRGNRMSIVLMTKEYSPLPLNALICRRKLVDSVPLEMESPLSNLGVSPACTGLTAGLQSTFPANTILLPVYTHVVQQ